MGPSVPIPGRKPHGDPGPRCCGSHPAMFWPQPCPPRPACSGALRGCRRGAQPRGAPGLPARDPGRVPQPPASSAHEAPSCREAGSCHCALSFGTRPGELGCWPGKYLESRQRPCGPVLQGTLTWALVAWPAPAPWNSQPWETRTLGAASTSPASSGATRTSQGLSFQAVTSTFVRMNKPQDPCARRQWRPGQSAAASARPRGRHRQAPLQRG